MTVEIDGKKETFLLKEKTFKSGSTGFYGFGKLPVDEKTKYQVTAFFVLIGSKPPEKKGGENR